MLMSLESIIHKAQDDVSQQFILKKSKTQEKER